MFAFSHKEFKTKQKTPILKSAIDAFNIFDLFVEVWKTMKWLWLAVVLRRPYVRQPEDGRFDIYDAFNGKRDVGIYGNSEAYAMLDIQGREDGSGNIDEESGPPSSLQPGKNYRKTPDIQIPKEPLSRNAILEPPQEYSSTYGKEKK